METYPKLFGFRFSEANREAKPRSVRINTSLSNKLCWVFFIALVFALLVAEVTFILLKEPTFFQRTRVTQKYKFHYVDNVQLSNSERFSLHLNAKNGLPDVTDKETVLSFAKMAKSAHEDDDIEFQPTESTEMDGNGLSGSVFVTHDHKFVIVSIKGPSAGFLKLGEEKDKHIFSCCCNEVNLLWPGGCDCKIGGKQCSSTCMKEDVAKFQNTYYLAGFNIYEFLRSEFPDSTIWFTGYSVGGAFASLFAASLDTAAVTFESPGEKMFAKHFGSLINMKKSNKMNIFHFGHTADPIFTGKCNKKLSSCHLGGYAIETKCHLGYTCVYNTGGSDTIDYSPEAASWTTNILHHKIDVVIKHVLEKWPSVPKCKILKCQDCSEWKYL